MKTIKMITLGLVASCLLASGLNAQGLLGERYLGINGGWERFENGVEEDGWGAGVEVNAPFPMADPRATYGSDLRLKGNYIDVFDRDIIDVEGTLRAYMTSERGTFKPFLGAGFGWLDFDVVDTTYVPVEAGVELTAGQFSLIPFFRYTFALDSAVDDFWSAGATGVLWMAETWGITASVDYRNYDDVGVFDEGVDRGIGARLGLVFAY
ncbi:MAG: hypothetical protein WD490_02795 [Opitutales bacterium]